MQCEDACLGSLHKLGEVVLLMEAPRVLGLRCMHAKQGSNGMYLQTTEAFSYMLCVRTYRPGHRWCQVFPCLLFSKLLLLPDFFKEDVFTNAAAEVSKPW